LYIPSQGVRRVVWPLTTNRLFRKPVHGLIFLFQYTSDDWDVDEESDTDDVWFANQVGGPQPGEGEGLSIASWDANAFSRSDCRQCLRYRCHAEHNHERAKCRARRDAQVVQGLDENNVEPPPRPHVEHQQVHPQSPQRLHQVHLQTSLELPLRPTAKGH
jgi:hypothetical protein